MEFAVTGSEGYVGQPLCKAIEYAGYQVVRFDAKLGHDIRDASMVTRMTKDCDAIVHMAAIVGYPQCDKDPQLAKAVNVQGTLNVVATGKKVIFTGALSNYDGVLLVDETTPVVPKTLYAETKAEAEQIVLGARKNVAVRFGSLYGVSPNMRMDLLVHDMVKTALSERKLSIYQSEYIRALTRIEDAIHAIIFFLTSNNNSIGGLYNVVSLHRTKREIAEAVATEVPCQVDYVTGEDRENRNYRISTDKIQDLGFCFYPNFRESVYRIAEFLRSKEG